MEGKKDLKPRRAKGEEGREGMGLGGSRYFQHISEKMQLRFLFEKKKNLIHIYIYIYI